MRDTRIIRIWVGIVVFSIGLHGTIPLSSYYRKELGASTGDLTLLYSLYAFGLLPALVVFGTSSDAVGRRRVVLPSMVLTTVASMVLAAGGALPVVFAARFAQGWATGMFWGASSAFLLDHVQVEHRLDASMALSATFMGSISAGVMVFGAAYSVFGSATGPWLLHVAFMVVAMVLVLTVADRRPRTPWAGVRVALPQAVHRRFFFRFITPITFGLIGLGAYVVALGPTFVAEASSTSSVGLQGAAVSAALACGAAAQVVTRRVDVRHVTAAGSVLLPLGGAFLVLAVATHSLVVTVAGMALVGIGMGLAFRGLFAMAEQMTTPLDRAGVISTFSIVFYLANALPVVAAGYAVSTFGLATVTGVLTSTVAIAAGGAHVVLRRTQVREMRGRPYVA